MKIDIGDVVQMLVEVANSKPVNAYEHWRPPGQLPYWLRPSSEEELLREERIRGISNRNLPCP